MNHKVYKIAIVAGEKSGDILAAELMSKLKAIGKIKFLGVGGELMQRQGLNSILPMEQFSIIGIIGLLKKLPQLWLSRRKLLKSILEYQPDLFIGVDAPDLNLGIEKKLRKFGINTVHYVSPTIWAWRAYRIHKIKKSVNLMLTLFPFEEQIYRQHNIPVKFIGHPLANTANQYKSKIDIAKKLNLPWVSNTKVVAILPGSRKSEIIRLTEVFMQAAHQCWQKNKNLFFVVPMTNQNNYNLFAELFRQTNLNKLPVKIVLNNSREVIASADAVLCASGTATLETMLLNKPMVVAYRLSWLNAQIFKWLANIPYCALPNILSGEKIVAECLQEHLTVANLVDNLSKCLYDKNYINYLDKKFSQINAGLQGSEDAAWLNDIAKLLRRESNWQQQSQS